MPTFSTAARNAMVDAVVDLVDVGSTNPNGQLVILTAGDAVLATIDLADPSFGAAAAGVGTLLGVPLSATATGTGTAAKFNITDKDETVIYSGTVGVAGSGADAIIDTTSIETGDTVQLTSLTLTAPS